MGKILTFKGPYEEVEKLLREFYIEERELLKCEWMEEATRRAKDIPNWLVRFPSLKAPR